MKYQLIMAVDRFRVPPENMDAIHPQAPLPVEWACDLPELAGTFTAKRLRKAIVDGLLPAERHGRAIYVTRSGIREWRDRCRVHPSPPDYGSSPSADIATAASVRKPDGSSETERRRLALAAALATTSALKKR